MGDQIQETDIPAEIPQVNEGEVRRKSVLSGMWNGMKKGLLWGGVGGLVGNGILGGLTLWAGKTAVTTGTGLLPSVINFFGSLAMAPGVIGWVGKGIALLGTAVAGVLGYNAIVAGSTAAASPLGTAIATLGAVAVPAIGIMAVTLAAGAVIGGVAGAISGYMDSDKKVQQAHRAAKAQAQQLAFERQQVQKAIMQEQGLERQYAAQTQQLRSQGQYQEIGQLTPTAPYSQQLQDQGRDQGQIS